ncbi:MAG: Sucrose-6-phosphate hydrolase [Thermotogales bacterium 46_20]|nr:MAG: Sucrose-6-phosphate hydrolase [Thermotogales bacterium 46_20]
MLRSRSFPIDGGSIEFFYRGCDCEIILKDSKSSETLTVERGSSSSYMRVLWNLKSLSSKSVFVEVVDRGSDLDLKSFVVIPENTYEGELLFLEYSSQGIFVFGESELGELYESDSLRPRYHFTPVSGWLNDPNGLAHWQGYYHMFYQYNPFKPVWGTMHWGHAISKDLVHWKHMPIFLHRDDVECDEDESGAFSGSAYPDGNRLAVMYTKHWDPRFHRDKIAQSQYVVVTHDGINHEPVGSHAVIEPGEESLPNDFRDPKIFKEEDGLWGAVVGGSLDNKGRVILYRSKDLKNWSFSSVLYTCDENWARMVECPELLKLDGKHVLLISLVHYVEEIATYHAFHMVGRITDDTFEPDIVEKSDFGDDFYAAQTFIDDSGRRILIAWTKAYSDHDRTINRKWAGIQTIPRQLSLNEKGRLRMEPVPEIAALRTAVTPDIELRETTLGDAQLTAKLPSDSFEMEMSCSIDHPEDAIEIIIGSEDKKGEYISIGLNSERRLFIEVSVKEASDCSYHETLPLSDDVRSIDLRIFFDRSIVEVFADDYTISGTRKFRFGNMKRHLAVLGHPGVFIESLSVWEMSSIWKKGRQQSDWHQRV